MTLEDKLKEIKKGAIDIINERELEEKLRGDRPLNIKLGIDSTSPDIHLGHTIPLRKLRQFQELGHNINLLIGDYTALIGDPTGKSETRPLLTPEDIESNLETYTEQVFKILDPNKAKLVYNSEWLSNLSTKDIIHLSAKYTVQQLLQRRDFKERIDSGKPLSTSELIYPLLMGYDSVCLNTDIEIGGTDQLFNFMICREIQKAYGQQPEVIITLPLLEGVDGIKKMSKSLKNSIGLNNPPIEMYGKIMSISDTLMWRYYELLSDIQIDRLDKIRKEVYEQKANPIEYKQQLAKEIVVKYQGVEAANIAEDYFNRVHRKRALPLELESSFIYCKKDQTVSLNYLLKQIGKAKSNSEARRLVEQRAIKINGQVISDLNYTLNKTDGQVVQVGKMFFRELMFKDQ